MNINKAIEIICITCLSMIMTIHFDNPKFLWLMAILMVFN